MRRPSAIWNWSSRCSRVNRRNRRCFTCSIARAPAWAAACCAAVCSRPRSTWPKSKRRWTPWKSCIAGTILRAELAQASRIHSRPGTAAVEDLSLVERRPARSGWRWRDRWPSSRRFKTHLPMAKRVGSATFDDGSMKSPKSAIACLHALAEEPPVNLADGGAIRDGFDAASGRVARHFPQQQDLSRPDRSSASATRTGIASLKVRFNNVFGYYIEISKANLHLAPADYERKQTLVNAERFTTPELKELEGKILEAEEKIARHRARDLRAAARADLLACRAHQSHGGGRRRAGCHRRAGGSRRRESLRAPAIFRLRARCASWPAAIR